MATCRFCIEDISPRATRCPYCQSADPIDAAPPLEPPTAPGARAATVTRKAPELATPGAFIGWAALLAAVSALVGGIAFAGSPGAGTLILIVGGVVAGVLLQIGIIAKGVQVGRRRHF